MIDALNPVMAGSVASLPHVNSTTNSQPANTGFAEMVGQLASTAIAKIEQAENTSIAKMAGADIGLREVVDQVMAAQQALNTTLAIRDKIVQAYIEISHTQI